MFEEAVQFIRNQFGNNISIPLHAPLFMGNEKKYLNECIDSTYVSSVGPYVDEFEKRVADFVGTKYAVAVVSGTQALFVATKLVGAGTEKEVITQSLTFAATVNAIAYTGAQPVFIDVDINTLGMSSSALQAFLENNVYLKDGKAFNRNTSREIVACLPVHILGHPCEIDAIVSLCNTYKIPVIEDAAEGLGTIYKGNHVGVFGCMGIFSFNGNKVITTGGGGMLITNDENLAKQAKHITTTARVNHQWEVFHDQLGYNFRLPNINASLGVAQMESLPKLLVKKRLLADKYHSFFSNIGCHFIVEPEGAKSNYWLNGVLLSNLKERNDFLEYTNNLGIMTRALWRPMHLLDMYCNCQTDDLQNTSTLFERVVTLPSSVIS